MSIRFAVVAFTLALSGASAATLTFSGDGGLIPDFDIVPGEANFDIAAVDPLGRTVLAGNSVEVRLIGLLHEYAADLVIRVTHVDSGTTRDLFGSIGVSESTPASSNFFGNYSFRAGFAGDLWSTSIALGDADFIDEGEYFPTSDGTSAANDMSSAFAGLDVTGFWRLTILDTAGDPFPPTQDLIGWELLIDVEDPVTVPEPSTAVLVAMAGLLVGVIRRVS